MTFSSTHPFVKELIERLGLPKRCTSIVIRMAVNEATTVECEFYPDAPAETSEVQRKHYRLEETVS